MQAYTCETAGSQELAALAAAEAAALSRRPELPPSNKAAKTAAEREPLRAMQPPDAAQGKAEAAHAPRAALEAAPPPLPLLRFGGRVQVASTAAEVDAAVASVYAGRHALVGWDIEWRVSFQRGAVPEKMALMQLALPGGAAGPPCVHLLRVCLSGVTPALAALLADAAVAKAGCAARNDAHKVGRDFGLVVNGVVDLSELAGTRLLPMQRWSLAALVQRALGCTLPKPNGVRVGAWDARELNAEQTAYAALDAWASLRVHVALATLPELPPPPPSNLPPLQPLGAGGGGCTFMPVLPAVAPLAPAKQSVLAAHRAGASVAQIAAQRGIKASTVENYLCDAMCVSPACALLALTSLFTRFLRLAVAPASPTALTCWAWMTPPRRWWTRRWWTRRWRSTRWQARRRPQLLREVLLRSAPPLPRRRLRVAGSRRSRRACRSTCRSAPSAWSSCTESARRRWPRRACRRRTGPACHLGTLSTPEISAALDDHSSQAAPAAARYL